MKPADLAKIRKAYPVTDRLTDDELAELFVLRTDLFDSREREPVYSE